MEQQIIDYLRRELLGEPTLDLAPDDDLLAAGLLGSMAIFRLIAHLEENFGVTIPPEEMTIDHFNSVTAIADYVRTRQTIHT